MRDLLTDPLWRPEDLGRPLPDSPHACSVCLPTWASVIGYEENDPAVTGRMQAGYPRFFCHPKVSELFALAGRTCASTGQRALVLPSRAAAEGLAEFVEARSDGKVVLEALGPLAVAVVDAAAEKTAKLFWRYCGQVVSSRLACAVLDGWPADRFATAEATGESARQSIRDQLGALSGQPAENVFLFASGMAGCFAVHQALASLKAGARTVQFGFPYVDVLKIQQEFAAGVHLIPGVGEAQAAQLEALVAGEPLAGIFCEVPSNPLIESPDLARLTAAAHSRDVPVAVDDTVGTVVNVDVLAHADLATTSLTKAFSGAGDVMAGSVIVNERSRWRDPLRAALAVHQRVAPLFGPDAEVLALNSRDFPARTHRMSESAAAVADFLASHPAVATVHYPTRHAGGAYDRIRRAGGGHGMLLSLTLDDPSATPRFFDRLRFCKGPGLGTNFSLACPFTLLAHYTELDWAESCGVSRHLVRISIGLEPAEELIRRIEVALQP